MRKGSAHTGRATALVVKSAATASEGPDPRPMLRIDRSGTALLIDVSGKKPVAHELPSTIIPGEGSEPDTGLTIISGGFSPDGRQLVLRDGTDQKGGRLPQVELVDVQTRELISSFTIKKDLEANGVALQPDGQQIFVWGKPETTVFSLEGKSTNAWGRPEVIQLQPSRHARVRRTRGRRVHGATDGREDAQVDREVRGARRRVR